ncbi:MFS transporter [Pengzhenrongella frigida]|uniref:DHA2 family efflux MFS transporter permease subunit n=1 Tax=Pengzhenrongella frigida TaxID=1259133 RepID=A0A4Q5N0D8_9MICO|nr:MFS transporter [Cellulomonas sp. HLT2-17]RYV49461.1 DHA2 family efflux MFS transporter permease subunit [Cellulomonas sp. HLT2-17]
METAAPHGNRRWWVLAVIGLAQLTVVLDGTIVNIALPSAQADLGISDASRSWVVTAYALAFGALLLLGGRVADYWGRKRAFLTGMIGFAVASAIGGVAQSAGELFAARALQGVFAALLAPAALALLTVTFPTGRDRGTAFAVFGAIGGGGAAIGMVVGGLLTEYASWRWCLLVNIPIAVVAVIAGARLIVESRATGNTRYDWPGVGLVSVGLGSLVYGFTQAEDGWTTGSAGGFIGLGVALLVLFVLVEARSNHPLLPLRIPAQRDRAAAFLAAFLTGTAMLGGLLFLTFYLQIVLAYEPVRAGLATLPMTAAIFLSATVSAQAMPRVGPRPLLAIGPVVAAGGLLLLAQLETTSTYAGHILPGLVLFGLGMGMVFVPMQNIALLGVDPHDSGAAGALVNAAQQVGGSLGTALFSTIALTTTTAFVPARTGTATAQLDALVAGYTHAFAWAAAIVLVVTPIALVLVRATKADVGGEVAE